MLKVIHTKQTLKIFIPFLVLSSITAISFLALSTPSSHAEVSDTKTATASVTVADACSLGRSTGTGSYTATQNNDTYNGNVGESTLSATCTDANGYIIYAVGYGKNSEGVNGIGVNSLIGPVSASDATVFNTIPSCSGDNCTSTNTDPSRWMMKVNAVSGTYTPTIHNDYTNFSEIPDDYVKIATYPSSTTYAGKSELKVNYGVAISSTQAAGTYTGGVLFKMLHPSNLNPDGTPGTKTIADATDMQDVSSKTEGGCPSTLVAGQVYTLTDTRDGNVYNVARLADGNCWMLDNLRLDLVSKKDVLSSLNTNATDTELGYLKNGGGTTSDRYATGGVQSNMNYNYSVPYINASYKDTTTTGYGNGSKKIGVYYNYCAASAGTYCFGNGSSSYGSPSGDATADICPSGWRMPTGGSNGEYQVLYTAYSSNATNFRNALSTPLSGYFNNGSVNNQGSYGYFWSSTYYSASSMYYLYVNSSNVRPQDSYDRCYGFSVRCVLK